MPGNGNSETRFGAPYELAVAAKALTLLIDFYKEKHLEVFSNPQSLFLEKQLTEYQQRLKESEDALESFKQKNRVYSLKEQRSLLLKQRIDLDTGPYLELWPHRHGTDGQGLRSRRQQPSTQRARGRSPRPIRRSRRRGCIIAPLWRGAIASL